MVLLLLLLFWVESWILLERRSWLEGGLLEVGVIVRKWAMSIMLYFIVLLPLLKLTVQNVIYNNIRKNTKNFHTNNLINDIKINHKSHILLGFLKISLYNK